MLDTTEVAHLHTGQSKDELVMDIYTFLSDNGATSEDAAFDAEWMAGALKGE